MQKRLTHQRHVSIKQSRHVRFKNYNVNKYEVIYAEIILRRILRRF